MANEQEPGERTPLASDRTALANERTLGARWRTSMAAFALALGFAKLFGDVEPAWLIRAGATILVLLGVLLLWTAARTYERTSRRPETEHVVVVSRRMLRVGTLLLGLVGTSIGAGVWLV